MRKYSDYPGYDSVVLSKIMSKVIKDETTGCWNYENPKQKVIWSGYSTASYKNRGHNVHRIVLMIWTNQFDDKFHACHTCDNRKCVNPKHLFWSIQHGNMLDKVKKKRQYIPPKGEKNWNSKLNYEKATEIRVLLAEGKLSQAEIGRRYGVAKSQINCIHLGKRWNPM